VAQSGDVRGLCRQILTTLIWVDAMALGQGRPRRPPAGFILAVTIWLWFTVLFANFAEAMAEGRSKAQAASLRGLKKETWAKKLRAPKADAEWHTVPATDLRKGDVVLVAAGETIPADGEVIEGVASVDESAITGESAPVIRESGGDFSAVTGGTRVLSDWLVVRVTVNPGETFVDRMIAMVESARGRRRPTRSR
jgi:K+-transporting ATPase ATPase B chain